MRLSIGEVRLTIGACVSRITNLETVVLFPAASEAPIVIIFFPSTRLITGT